MMAHKSFTSRPSWQVSIIVIGTYLLLDQLYVGESSRNLVKVIGAKEFVTGVGL